MKTNNEPKLRFSGFKGEWRNCHLRDVLNLVTRPIKMDDEKYYSLVTVKRRYEGIIPRGVFKGKEVKVKSQFLLQENDFLISKRQISHNACGVVPKDLSGAIVSNEYSVFTPKKELDIHYFNYFCKLPKVSTTFFLSSTGVHIEKMIFKVDVWFKYKFYFPSLPEQQKIASFLSAVDEKIQLLTRKKELLEQYKKGVMQQLFSGKLRFKDENGKDYPKWEEKRLKDICEGIKSGKGKASENGIFPLYGSTGIIGRCEDFSHDGTFILIARVGANAGTINFVQDRFGVSDNTLVLSCNIDNSMQYVYFYLRFFNLNKLIFGSGQPLITGGQLKELTLLLPSLNEQQKIANFLSVIDTKIANITTQITQTQTFKKGLLQQMFV